jgi:hypothetical protein
MREHFALFLELAMIKPHPLPHEYTPKPKKGFWKSLSDWLDSVTPPPVPKVGQTPDQAIAEILGRGLYQRMRKEELEVAFLRRIPQSLGCREAFVTAVANECLRTLRTLEQPSPPVSSFYDARRYHRPMRFHTAEAREGK